MPSPGSTGQPSVATGLPEPGTTGQQQGEPGQQSSGETGDSSRQGREQAGGELSKAGERVAQAGDQMGEQGQQSDRAGNEEPDPMLPEMDSTSDTDDLVFDESSSGPMGAEGETTGAPDTGSEASMQTAGGDPMSEDVRAAQEAMREAGILLQEAGDAVASAQTDEELQRARELLAEARVIVVVAGQDLMQAREAAGDGVDSAVFDEAEQSLNDANVAIVVATQAVEGMPDFDDLQTAGIPSGGTTLEDELEDSLGDFDKKILTARRTVLQPGGGGDREEGSMPPDDALPAGDREGEPGLATTDEETDGTPEPGSLPVSASNDGSEMVAANVPEDIGPGNDDDIVAQQLREAAMSETDPELREKLWEEYRRYKSGL